MSPVLTLPRKLDSSAADDLHHVIDQHRGVALTLDASHCGAPGGLCAQILIAAQKAWAVDGLALRISSPSSAFVDGWSCMGFPSWEDPSGDAGGNSAPSDVTEGIPE